MNPGRLNRIGVATTLIDRSVETYLTLLGVEATDAPTDLSAQGVRVCFAGALHPLGRRA